MIKLETQSISVCCAVMPCSSLGLMAPKERQIQKEEILRFQKVLGSVLTRPDCVVAIKILLQAETQQCQPIRPVIFTS